MEGSCYGHHYTGDQVFTYVPDKKILKLSLSMGINSDQLSKLKKILIKRVTN